MLAGIVIYSVKEIRIKANSADLFPGLIRRVLLIIASLSLAAGGVTSHAQFDDNINRHDRIDDVSSVLREEADIYYSPEFDGSMSRVYGGGIGNDAVPYVGFIDAIDVASRQDFWLCFPVEAKTIFLDAETWPREISDLPSAVFYKVGGIATTCAWVTGNGTVALVTPGSHRRLTSESWLSDNVGKWTGKAGGALAGGFIVALKGGATCAALGSVIPLFGSAAGAVVCGIGGFVVGAIIGDASSEYIGRPVGEAIVSGGFWVYDVAGNVIDGDYPCLITPSYNLYVREEPWGDIVGVLDSETTVHPVAIAVDEGGGFWYGVFGADNGAAQDVGLHYIYARWVEKKGRCT